MRGLLQAGARLHVEGSEGWAEGRGKRGLSGGTQSRGWGFIQGTAGEGKEPRVSSRRNGKPLAGLK